MTGNQFAIKYSEAQLKEIARDIAGSIVIRSYDEHGSRDDRRETTEVEKTVIKNIAYGAMLAYAHCGSLDGILNMAEFTLKQWIPTANTYDSIYTPLRNVTETW